MSRFWTWFSLVFFLFITACSSPKVKADPPFDPASVCLGPTMQMGNNVIYSPNNTSGAILDTEVRNSIPVSKGWVFTQPNGDVKYLNLDERSITHCKSINGLPNALAVFGNRLIIASDSHLTTGGGLIELSKQGLYDLTSDTTDYRAYALTQSGKSLIEGTWSQLSIRDAKGWKPYRDINQRLANDHVDAVLLYADDDYVFGFIHDGAQMLFHGKSTVLKHVGSDDPYAKHALSGDEVRVIRKNPFDGSIWIGSDGDATIDISNDGGIAVWKDGVWTYHDKKDGLPAGVQDISFSIHGLSAVATDEGTYLLCNKKWQQISSLPAYTAQFGMDKYADKLFIGHKNIGTTKNPDQGFQILTPKCSN